MPVIDNDLNVQPYPLSKRGVNIYSNLVDLHLEECVQSQNLIYRSGMIKRGGQTLGFNNTEAVSSKAILGLHKFYYGSSKVRLVACDTKVVKDDEDDTWTDVKTGLTTGLQTYFVTWGALSKVFVCNGTDEMWSWDGTTVVDYTLSDGVPAYALPYQDRLLTIINDSNGGNLTWSASFDATEANWETIANCGVRPDIKLYGMIHHSLNNSDSGYRSGVLLAGADGMYLFQGTDLRVPFTTGDYTIYQLPIPVGCNAPLTMQWTPKGTMWLGIDGQVYILPFDSPIPVSVSTKIQSQQDAYEGIEKIPAAQIEKACAAYHDGFYKLSVTVSGGSNNTNQWWLDVNRFHQDESGLFGPWYGPMDGQSISCFALQNGPGDSGELIGGEATAKGYIYDLGKYADYGDIDNSDASAKAIQIYWFTAYNPLGNPDLVKEVEAIEVELLDVLGTVNVNFWDITGSLKTGDSIGLSGSAIYWDDAYWNDQDWSSSSPTRQMLNIIPQIICRRMGVIITHNISTDKFELYSLKALVKERRNAFELANMT